jgi:hypothetical protein
LPSKYKALSSNPSTTKKKKRLEKSEERQAMPALSPAVTSYLEVLEVTVMHFKALLSHSRIPVELTG